jgi:quinol monooxygenase YgiN
MLCALTVRRIKAGKADEFAEKFGPPTGAEAPAGWKRFTMARDLSDPDVVVTFGHFDGSLEDLDRSQADSGYEELRSSVDDLVEEVLVNGVFEILREENVGS